jgi:hypothetical protein
MDLGQTLFDTRSRLRINFFPMSRDAIIHELCAIGGENYLLLEFYKQNSSIFQVMPEIVVLPWISASRPTPRSGSAPLRPRRLFNPLDAFPWLTTLPQCFGVVAADKNVVNEYIELTPHLDLG